MKVTWDPDDICPGRRVMKPGTGEERIIGFDSRLGQHEPRWAVISLADGSLLCVDCTRDEIATYLNSLEIVPMELIDPVTGRLRHRRANGPTQ